VLPLLLEPLLLPLLELEHLLQGTVVLLLAL
jgi:hypothetical protein